MFHAYLSGRPNKCNIQIYVLFIFMLIIWRLFTVGPLIFPLSVLPSPSPACTRSQCGWPYKKLTVHLVHCEGAWNRTNRLFKTRMAFFFFFLLFSSLRLLKQERKKSLLKNMWFKRYSQIKEPILIKQWAKLLQNVFSHMSHHNTQGSFIHLMAPEVWLHITVPV